MGNLGNLGNLEKIGKIGNLGNLGKMGKMRKNKKKNAPGISESRKIFASIFFKILKRNNLSFLTLAFSASSLVSD